jgi:hypothetical protein
VPAMDFPGTGFDVVPFLVLGAVCLLLLAAVCVDNALWSRRKRRRAAQQPEDAPRGAEDVR